MSEKGAVLWFTGLSGSGKSTITELLYKKMEESGIKTEHLDGDVIRDMFPGTGFSREDRNAHIKRVGHMSSLLEKHGVFVLVSLISPFRESRDFVRGVCGNFVEIYVSTPLEECERRDVKGLYGRARKGEIKDFTGISSPFEPPEKPEIEIDTRDVSVDEAAEKVMKYIKEKFI
ncbi:MAG: adenylyl-sulfate kinase [Fibrobacterota bacterium]